MPLPFEHSDRTWPPWAQSIPELQRLVNEALKDVRLDFSDPIRGDPFGGTDEADMQVTVTNGSPYLLRGVVVDLKATGAATILRGASHWLSEIEPHETVTYTIRIQAQNLTYQTGNPQDQPAYFTGSISAEVIPMAVDDHKGYKTVNVFPQ